MKLIPFDKAFTPIIDKWHRNPELRSRVGFYHPYSEGETDNLINGWSNCILQMFIHNERFVGYTILESINVDHRNCILHTVIGEPEYWGKKVGVDACDAILDYAFNKLCMHRVSTYVLSNNPKLLKQCIKYGWKLEGTMREVFVREDTGERLDYSMLGILKTEFRKRGTKCH